MKIPLRSYWRLLAQYLRPQKRQAGVLAVLLLAGLALQIANPQIISHFIDTATHNGSDRELTLTAIVFLAFALTQQAVTIAAVYYGENVGWTATNMLRQDLALHCLRLDMTFHNDRTPGELIERIEQDVSALANFFSQFVVRVMGNFLLVLGVLVVLWTIDWRIGLAFTVLATTAFVSMGKLRARAVPFWMDAHQASAELYGFLEERLAGTEDIRASGGNLYVQRRLDEEMNKRAGKWRKAWWRNFTVFTTMRVFIILSTFLAFAINYSLYRAGDISLGTVFAVVFYTQMLYRPLEQIANLIQELQRAGGAINRIEELYAIQPTIKDGAGVEFPSGPLSVQFDHLTFGYNAAEPVLKDMDFELAPGKVLGLLGRTGAGKTTIARLLFRLYEPQEGAIRLSGHNITDATLVQLRQYVGIVTQDVQLFRATIRDNLTLFDRTIPDEKIMAVIDELELHDWFETLPDGLDTRLESGGKGVSAGEAQLLAFTRIFLRNPGLVIMDEASSRLDPATERRIERAVDKLLTNRTGIIIAHRLGTVTRADQIMILEDGQIAEHGNYDDLVNDPNSRFYHLLQTGLQEVLA